MRAHQCVMEGYEYFAKGHLITIFSATNYCGIQRNNGAILHVTDRKDHWLITPKYIECEMTPNTWVNLPKQLPPSPMRAPRRANEAPASVSAFDAEASPYLFGDTGYLPSPPIVSNSVSAFAQPYHWGTPFTPPVTKGNPLSSPPVNPLHKWK